MSMEKMLSHTTPINKDAALIIRPAKLEDVWMPEVKVPAHTKHDINVLKVKPIPRAAFNASGFVNPIGKRRGRFVVVGYAAEQPETNIRPARWVVRCDCGNFEHRTRILRWLGTDADDMCLECRLRTYKTHGEFCSREKASRSTKAG